MISRLQKKEAVRDFLKPIIAAHYPNFEYRVVRPLKSYSISSLPAVHDLMGDPIRYVEIISESTVEPLYPDFQVREGNVIEQSNVIQIEVWLERYDDSELKWEELWQGTSPGKLGIIPALEGWDGPDYSDGCSSFVEPPSEPIDFTVQPVKDVVKLLCHYGQTNIIVS